MDEPGPKKARVCLSESDDGMVSGRGPPDSVEEDGELPPAPQRTFGDYIDWHEQFLNSAEGQREIQKARQQAEELELARPIRLDHPRPTFAGTRIGSIPVTIPVEFFRVLRTKATNFQKVVALVAAAVALCGRKERVSLAYMHSGRPEDHSFHDVIGCFAHQVLLILNVHKWASFEDLLKQVRDKVNNAPQNVPIQIIEKHLTEKQGIKNADPLFQFMVLWQKKGGWAQNGKKTFLNSTCIADFWFDGFEPDHTRQLLSVDCMLRYNSSLFTAQTMGQLAEKVKVLADAIVKDPTAVMGNEGPQKQKLRNKLEALSGHTLLDIDATIAKPTFNAPISMKAMQNVMIIPKQTRVCHRLALKLFQRDVMESKMRMALKQDEARTCSRLCSTFRGKCADTFEYVEAAVAEGKAHQPFGTQTRRSSFQRFMLVCGNSAHLVSFKRGIQLSFQCNSARKRKK